MSTFPYESLVTPPRPRAPWRWVFRLHARNYFRRRSVIIVILLANIPTVVAAVLLYLIGQGKQFGPISESLPAISLKLAKPFVDSFLTASAILGAIIGPSAIAGQRRAGAVLFHLIRPMTARELVAGHWLAVSFVLLFTTCVPLLLLFVFARLVIPAALLGSLPWHAGLRVAAFGLAIAAFVGLATIAVSSLAGSNRSAFLLWLMLYFGSQIAMDVLRSANVGAAVRCLGVPDTLKQLASYILEGRARFEGCGPWWIMVIAAVVVGSLMALSRGVSAVERT